MARAQTTAGTTSSQRKAESRTKFTALIRDQGAETRDDEDERCPSQPTGHDHRAQECEQEAGAHMKPPVTVNTSARHRSNPGARACTPAKSVPR